MLFEVLHTAHRGQRWTGHAMTVTRQLILIVHEMGHVT